MVRGESGGQIKFHTTLQGQLLDVENVSLRASHYIFLGSVFMIEFYAFSVLLMSDGTLPDEMI